MYLRHELYTAPIVYVPGSKTEETVQFSNSVAECKDAVGKKLVKSDDITEISQEEYEAAADDLRHDLPMVHTKDGRTRHTPAPGEQPNPMSKNDPDLPANSL